MGLEARPLDARAGARRWRTAGLAAALGLIVGGAQAAPITMTCKNELRRYQLTFDEEQNTLVWRSGDLRTQYLVEKVKKDDADLIVWGRTRAHGNDYVAQFAPVKTVTYHYPNLSKQTDSCQ
jgi:hypothetical protein